MRDAGGAYHVRFAETDADVIACQGLRQRCFFGGAGLDADPFDEIYRHLMVLDGAGAVRATLRLRVASGRFVLAGYVGQYYDLSSFAAARSATLEIGRMCVDPGQADPLALRLAWGALTRIADTLRVALIFGCSSFAGVDPRPHAQSFARLVARYQAPAAYGPFRKSDDVVPLADVATGDVPQTPMPPLLRTYLTMGGWVSDHAVADPAMNTLHVLTGLETANVPAQRAAALRVLAAQCEDLLTPIAPR